TLKHACEINDVVLNWKKIKKFINSEKTGNETNGRDRDTLMKKYKIYWNLRLVGVLILDKKYPAPLGLVFRTTV
ncbi:MAG: hypothetical protein WCF21_02020, partial [Nitrososphaeraceae archaeon]